MPTIFYWQDQDTGVTEQVRFDSIISQTHEDTAEITSHPVEVGMDPADHRRKQPNTYTVEGFVSNMPQPYDDDASYEQVDITVPRMKQGSDVTKRLDIPTPPVQPSPSGVLQAGISAIKNAIAGAPKGQFRGKSTRTSEQRSVQMLKQDTPRSRVRDVYELLQKADVSNALITIQTDTREHFDMMIERLALPQEVDNGEGAAFSVDLRRIRVATSETVQSPQPAEARGSLGKAGGSKNGEEDPNGEGKQEVADSILTQGTGFGS